MTKIKCIDHHKNPGEYSERTPDAFRNPRISEEEFLERENASYGMDLGGDCVPQDSEIDNKSQDVWDKIRETLRNLRIR